MLICGQKNSVEKKAANLRKQAVTTKCRGEFQCGAKSRDFEKAVDFRALKICDNLWIKSQTTDVFYRPQIDTDLHRLRAKGSDD